MRHFTYLPTVCTPAWRFSAACILCAIVPLLGLFGPASFASVNARATTPLRVVATVPNLAAIAGQIGGERVEVQSIAAGTQDPHYLHARPSYARLLHRADLVIANGLDLEAGWLPPLLEAARNPAIRPGAKGFLDASESVEQVLEIPVGVADRSRGDIHASGNPHYDLDPRNGIRIARAIAGSLSALDPAGEGDYRRNADAFAQDMEERIAVWSARAETARGRPIVTFHKQWEYLASWLGLEIAGQVEDRPGIPPSPRHLRDLIALIRDRGISVVVAAPFNDARESRGVADRSGSRLLILPTSVGAEKQIRTYQDLFDTILDRLLPAVRAEGTVTPVLPDEGSRGELGTPASATAAEWIPRHG